MKIDKKKYTPAIKCSCLICIVYNISYIKKDKIERERIKHVKYNAI